MAALHGADPLVYDRDQPRLGVRSPRAVRSAFDFLGEARFGGLCVSAYNSQFYEYVYEGCANLRRHAVLVAKRMSVGRVN